MTLNDLLDSAADRDPQSVALICGDTAITRDQLRRASSALANWLLDQPGLEPGSRVAIHWCNSIEFVTLYFACFRAGMIAVPVNVRLKAPEVAWILSHSEPSICFSQPELVSLTTQAMAEAGIPIPIHSSLPVTGAGSREVLSRGTSPCTPGDACAIFYTSGTTARPKGVTHTHASLAATARLTETMLPGERSIAMSLTQISHMSGMALLLAAVLGSHTYVLLPVFEPGVALTLMERRRVGCLLGMPALLGMLAEEQSRRPRDISALRACLVGGDAAPLALHQRFHELFATPLHEVIGMTESVPISWNVDGDVLRGSCGKPRQGVETRILPLEGDETGAGEMTARSAATFSHYWRDPEATAETLRDGWIHTGDLVRQDAEGYLWFAGRLKHIIVRGGSNISPQEVEEAISTHPSVLETGVVGLPDALWGHSVAASVVLRENHSLSEDELRDFVRVRLSDHKVPERISFLPALPAGPTGKLDRRALSELWQL